MAETQPNQSFFGEGVPNGTKSEEKKNESTFVSKGSNRQLKEPWNIHFTVDSAIFSNLVEFINQINYDVVMIFRKKELIMTAIDTSDTHAGIIKFDYIEFSEYEIKNLKDDNDEKIISVDVSIIVDRLSINEKFPIDFYVDTIDKNRFYVVCGKSLIERQLGEVKSSTSEGRIKRHKGFENSVSKWLQNTDYQKIVINSNPLTSLMKSLSKKKEKGKDKSTLVSLSLNKSELNFGIDNEVERYSDILSNEDIMVYPINEKNVEFDLDYFNKFSKLKLSYTAAMYVHSSNLPMLFESKLGGGKIIVYFMLALRVQNPIENK